MKFLILSICLVFCFGCNNFTPPQKYNYEKSKSYNSNYDKTWDKIIQWIASNDVQFDKMDKLSGLIVLKKTYSDFDPTFCDCGKRDFAGGIDEIYLSANVAVQKLENGGTKVTVNSFYKCKNSNMTFGITKGESTGKLEENIFSYLD